MTANFIKHDGTSLWSRLFVSDFSSLGYARLSAKISERKSLMFFGLSDEGLDRQRQASLAVPSPKLMVKQQQIVSFGV